MIWKAFVYNEYTKNFEFIENPPMDTKYVVFYYELKEKEI